MSPQCLELAIAACRPGMRYRDVGDIITRHASAAGLSVVKAYCGHGIGDLFHCAPNVHHYAHNKARGVMKEGEVFTIEPMICVGSHRDKTWPDGWWAAAWGLLVLLVVMVLFWGGGCLIGSFGIQYCWQSC